MCGIFGYTGKDPKKFNKDKFDKLGLYNVTRGKDSCGVSFDGDIIVGAHHSDKLYSDFIVKNNKIKPLKYPIVIGHTRSASFGNAVNIDNAHPFGFGVNKKDDCYELIGCHNGTLYNAKELAAEFDIETIQRKVEINSFGVKSTVTRNKIDSEILLEAIYANKNFKVLSKYTGAAAIVFTNTYEPNKLYVFKGASKNYGWIHEKVEEERPLFYYIENKNSLYFSSIKDSLISIGGDEDKNIFSFENNTLYIITDGDIKNAETMIISRDNSTQKEKTTTTNYSSYPKKSQSYYDNDVFNSTAIDAEVEEYTKNKLNCKVGGIYGNKVKSNIYNEGLLIEQNKYGKRVYFNKLRYWQKGHLINGIYIFVENYGFYKIEDESILKAGEALKKLINIPFVDNDFDFDCGIEEAKEKELFIPFKKLSLNNLYYFVEGCRLRTSEDFKVFIHARNMLHKSEYLDAVKLSYISAHPVINLTVKLADNNEQHIIKDGLNFSGTICPLGAERVYIIAKGNLITSTINSYAKSTIWGEETVKYKSSKIIDLPFINTTTEKSQNIILPPSISKDLKEENVDKRNYESIVIKEWIEDKEVNTVEDDNTGELLLELINEDVSEFSSMINRHISTLSHRVNKNPKEIEIFQELKNIKDQLTIIFENEKN